LSAGDNPYTPGKSYQPFWLDLASKRNQGCQDWMAPMLASMRSLNQSFGSRKTASRTQLSIIRWIFTTPTRGILIGRGPSSLRARRAVHGAGASASIEHLFEFLFLIRFQNVHHLFAGLFFQLVELGDLVFAQSELFAQGGGQNEVLARFAWPSVPGRARGACAKTGPDPVEGGGAALAGNSATRTPCRHLFVEILSEEFLGHLAAGIALSRHEIAHFLTR